MMINLKRSIYSVVNIIFILLFVIIIVLGQNSEYHVYTNIQWSLNSQHLAFLQDSGELYLYDSITAIYKDIKFIEKPIYSLQGWYDNEHLWFDYFGGLSELDIKTKEYRRIELPPEYSEPGTDLYPSEFTFSYDRQFIIFANRDFLGIDKRQQAIWSENDLWQIDLTTMEVTRLTNTPHVDEYSPQYSPNGTILIAGDRYFKDNEWQLIPNFFAHPGRYSLSPDGDYILTRQNDPHGIYILPINGSNPPELVAEVPVAELAWSPNGCYIAYTTVGQPGSNELIILFAKDLSLQDYIPDDDLCIYQG